MELSFSLALVGKQKYSLTETLILKVLGKMNKGRLTLTMPNGDVLRFGNTIYEVSANMTISNANFFKRCLLYGDIGFAESYVAGEWDTNNIHNVISWFILNNDTNPAITGTKIKVSFTNILKLFNRVSHINRNNTLDGSKENISEHYDLGNDFYKLFLDKTMTYSSAIFSKPKMTLEEAQIEKYDRLCRLLKLKSTDHVLEIGSGWGGFAAHAAKNYSCKITTVTISQEQFNYAKARFEKEGVADKVKILLEDYRNIVGKFDKIVSIEMLEAVGHEYIPTYFKKCNEVLKDNGLIALQVITSPDKRYNEIRKSVDFIQKHIFPGSLLPSVARINECVNKNSDLNLYDIKDIGIDYADTLKLWYNDFMNKKEEVKELGMSETFIRKWKYYLQYCEAAFRMRNISTMQLVYTRPNNHNF